MHTETGRLPLSFPVSECLALNPVGRTTYCIRLPGGRPPAVSPEENSASLRLKKRSICFLTVFAGGVLAEHL